MAKPESAPIILITHTKIEIPTPEVRQKPSPKKEPQIVIVHEKPKEKSKKASKPAKAIVKTPKASKIPAVKPSSETTPEVAAKNQEAVKAGRIPDRIDVEPGRYNMLLS